MFWTFISHYLIVVVVKLCIWIWGLVECSIWVKCWMRWVWKCIGEWRRQSDDLLHLRCSHCFLGEIQTFNRCHINWWICGERSANKFHLWNTARWSSDEKSRWWKVFVDLNTKFRTHFVGKDGAIQWWSQMCGLNGTVCDDRIESKSKGLDISMVSLRVISL